MISCTAQTKFLDPVQDETDFQIIREYPCKDELLIKIFQSCIDPTLVYYGLAKKDGSEIKISYQLEVIGIPSHLPGEKLQPYLSNTYATTTRYESGGYKIYIFPKLLGGGWKEGFLGAIAIVAGVMIFLKMSDRSDSKGPITPYEGVIPHSCR